MKKIMKIIMIILIIISLATYYFYYISYHSLTIENYTIRTHKITDDIHIAMLCDIHDSYCPIKDKIIHQLKTMDIDIILCVGDMIDKSSQSDKEILVFLDELQTIAPTYMSLGNQEIDYYKDYDILKKHITLLDKSYKNITIKNQKIRLGGMFDYAFSLSNGKIDKESLHKDIYTFLYHYTNTDIFTLMMAHRPDSFIFGDAGKWDIDLICSGHIHGGQVILPFIGGLYAPDQGYFPDYDFGLYSLSKSQLIISRGISSSKEKLPRINNIPEITFITLQEE